MKKKAKRKSKSTTKNLPPIGPTHLSAEYISLDDLYHAYRKAKVDVFFERSQPMALEFCQYEKNLRHLQQIGIKIPTSLVPMALFQKDYSYLLYLKKKVIRHISVFQIQMMPGINSLNRQIVVSLQQN